MFMMVRKKLNQSKEQSKDEDGDRDQSDDICFILFQLPYAYNISIFMKNYYFH